MAPSAKKKSLGAKTRAAKSTRRSAARTEKRHANEGGEAHLDDDDCADEGRESSRRFFKKAKTSTRRLNAQRAIYEINKRAAEFAAFIDEQEKHCHSSTAVDDAVRVLLEKLPQEHRSLLAPNAVDAESDDMSFNMAHNPIYLHAKQALDSFQTRIQAFEAERTRDLGIQIQSWMTWEQDTIDVKKFHECALDNAAQIIHGIIIPDEALPKLHRTIKDGSVEKAAWDIFSEVRPVEKEKTWGLVAQKQVRAIGGILDSTDE